MNTMSFMKGMGAGLIAGACIGMMLSPDKKKGKRALSKAVRAVETVIGDISDVISL